MKTILLALIVVIFADLTKARSFRNRELLHELIDNHKLPLSDALRHLCVITKRSSMNTNIVSSNAMVDYYGLYQISNKWCDSDGGCNITCAKLVDDDISDDVKCASEILKQHGTNGWGISEEMCTKFARNFTTTWDITDENAEEMKDKMEDEKIPEPTTSSINNIRYLKKCELVKKLVSKFSVTKKQAATWTCIAEHESKYNTSKQSSRDNLTIYGVFQIDSTQWCNADNSIQNECDIPCEYLLDNDFENDFQCAQLIHNTLNGFNYWPSYEASCKNVDESFVQECFHSMPESLVTSTIESKTYTTSTEISIVNWPIVQEFTTVFPVYTLEAPKNGKATQGAASLDSQTTVLPHRELPISKDSDRGDIVSQIAKHFNLSFAKASIDTAKSTVENEDVSITTNMSVLNENIINEKETSASIATITTSPFEEFIIPTEPGPNVHDLLSSIGHSLNVNFKNFTLSDVVREQNELNTFTDEPFEIPTISPEINIDRILKAEKNLNVRLPSYEIGEEATTKTNELNFLGDQNPVEAATKAITEATITTVPSEEFIIPTESGQNVHDLLSSIGHGLNVNFKNFTLSDVVREQNELKTFTDEPFEIPTISPEINIDRILKAEQNLNVRLPSYEIGEEVTTKTNELNFLNDQTVEAVTKTDIEDLITQESDDEFAIPILSSSIDGGQLSSQFSIFNFDEEMTTNTNVLSILPDEEFTISTLEYDHDGEITTESNEVNEDFEMSTIGDAVNFTRLLPSAESSLNVNLEQFAITNEEVATEANEFHSFDDSTRSLPTESGELSKALFIKLNETRMQSETNIKSSSEITTLQVELTDDDSLLIVTENPADASTLCSLKKSAKFDLSSILEELKKSKNSVQTFTLPASNDCTGNPIVFCIFNFHFHGNPTNNFYFSTKPPNEN